jgi:hypothetical protein
LIERSQFAHNPRCYVKGEISALKEHGFDGSWLQWFLKETETFQGEQKVDSNVMVKLNSPQLKLVDLRGESYKVIFTPSSVLKLFAAQMRRLSRQVYQSRSYHY